MSGVLVMRSVRTRVCLRRPAAVAAVAAAAGGGTSCRTVTNLSFVAGGRRFMPQASSSADSESNPSIYSRVVTPQTSSLTTYLHSRDCETIDVVRRGPSNSNLFLNTSALSSLLQLTSISFHILPTLYFAQRLHSRLSDILQRPPSDHSRLQVHFLL